MSRLLVNTAVPNGVHCIWQDVYFFFLADFLAAGVAAAGGAAGCCSGVFATVRIWICRLTGEAGRDWSMNCSSPTPSDWMRLPEILKVLTNTSRTASARRWLRITLASRDL